MWIMNCYPTMSNGSSSHRRIINESVEKVKVKVDKISLVDQEVDHELVVRSLRRPRSFTSAGKAGVSGSSGHAPRPLGCCRRSRPGRQRRRIAAPRSSRSAAMHAGIRSRSGIQDTLPVPAPPESVFHHDFEWFIVKAYDFLI
jgi:hypothetical protein